MSTSIKLGLSVLVTTAWMTTSTSVARTSNPNGVRAAIDALSMVDNIQIYSRRVIARAGKGPPKINFAASCRAAAKGNVGLVQSLEGCRHSEQAARETLVKQWSTFAGGDRQSCYRLTTTGTPGTYTELLTCLEMRRDARSLGASNAIRTRG
jgi:hypothetical protein